MKHLLASGTAFILGVGAGWIIQGRLWDVFLTSYIPALATLVAAFYGAKYAFQFQKDKELEEVKRRNIVNVNATIFTLSRMANELFLYQRDVIEPVRNSPACFIELRPTLELEKEIIQVDLEALYFLLETNHRNLVGEIVSLLTGYRTVIEAINKRSAIHLDSIQPTLEKAGLQSNGNYTIEEIKEFLGDRLYGTLVDSTDQVIEIVDEVLVSIKDSAKKLRVAALDLYPGENVISFALPETNQQS